MMRFTSSRFSAGAALQPERYHVTARWMHWTMGGLVAGAVSTILYKQSLPKDDPGIGAVMWWHKSCGVTVAMLLPLRIALFFATKRPGMIPGSGVITHTIGTAAHYALYAFLVAMAFTGVGMGYASGRNIPFWFTEIETGPYYANPANAKWHYGWHVWVGYYGKFLIPVHAAGAVTHHARGQAIFTRMNPFA